MPKHDVELILCCSGEDCVRCHNYRQQVMIDGNGYCKLCVCEMVDKVMAQENERRQQGIV